jgi:hypothetical protein
MTQRKSINDREKLQRLYNEFVGNGKVQSISLKKCDEGDWE